GSAKASDKAELDRIAACFEDNRNCLGRRLRRERRRSAGRSDHRHLTMNKIGYHCRQPITLTLTPTVFDRDALALHIAGLLQPLTECGRHWPISVRRPDVEETDKRHVWLLRTRGQRPCCGGADKRDEFPSPHGFAHAEDYIGYAKNSTFLDCELCRRLRLTGRPPCPLWVISGHSPIFSRC